MKIRLPHIHWWRIWNTYPLVEKCRCGKFRSELSDQGLAEFLDDGENMHGAGI